MKKFICITVLFLLSFNSYSIFGKTEYCEKLDTQEQGAFISTNKYLYQVVGRNKAYFYSAPSMACKQNDIYIINGDLVYVYTELNGFYSVMYNSKRLGLISGWIKEDRLVQTEYTIRP